MHNKSLFLLVLLLVLSSPLLALDQQRITELDDLLHQDCGSCHGMRLTGGLGPALNKESLQGKSSEFLTVTIRDGRPGTPMPPWKDLLTAEEINWMVKTIKNYQVENSQ